MKHFHNSFCDYINHCKNKSKDGIGRISTNGFKFFLQGLDFQEIMKQIEEVNNKDNTEEFEKNNIFKCKSCNWQGDEPISMIMHDENYKHYYIYMCPKCGKRVDICEED